MVKAKNASRCCIFLRKKRVVVVMRRRRGKGKVIRWERIENAATANVIVGGRVHDYWFG